MRIAIVSPYDLSVPGGVQSHVDQLAATLRQLGDEVAVIGPGGSGEQTDVAGSVSMRFNGSLAPIALAPTARRRTRAALAAFAPDVIHVHEPMVPWVGLAAVRPSIAPVVATFHAYSDASRAYRLARPIGRRLLRGISASVAVSPAAAKFHGNALGVGADAFTVVPNGVNVATFAGSAAGRTDPSDPGRDHARTTDLGAGNADVDDGGPTVLFVGRLEQRKGLEGLIRAFPSVKKHCPDVRLLVVGEGPERERCESLLAADVRDAVHFLGRVDADELVELYRSADLYVSPALGGESFGIVLLEAMAAGTPVVASDIFGYRSVVTDGDTGVLVPPQNAHALAQAIIAVLGDDDMRTSLIEAGRAHADQFDWPVVTQRLRRIYEQVRRPVR